MYIMKSAYPIVFMAAFVIYFSLSSFHTPQEGQELWHRRENNSKTILEKPKTSSSPPRRKKKCSCGNWGKWHSHGKETPLCCRKDSIRALKSLVQQLNVHDVPYSLTGGTLLGAVRCGEFIKYDYDVDIDLFTDTKKAKRVLDHWHKTSGIFSEMRVTVSSLPWNQQEFSGSSLGDVHFDIGVKQTVPLLVQCVFEDVVMSCLADYNNVLIKKYGKDWLVPHRWKKWPTSLSTETDHTIDYCKHKRDMLRSNYPHAAVATKIQSINIP